ncbi:unnamed protein product [Mytilus coruscus]|uniref:Endonuclease/exonuclease/phosphatase domain-containing protein n=1 Tax=Mytilus coruscus TaxID=42192 RepID=A0A6J8E318_MYTCO|nr:unnamed protein product [Mytilus coruscus]
MEVKENSSYLNTLEMASDIICIQEHWLYEFQKQVLGHVLPNMDMHIRCSDTNEEIDNFKLPRGKGGVAIAWKNHLTPSVQEIQSGNNRIIAVELKSPFNICIICVYMPTNNSGDSYLEYTECLDIISSIFSTYSATHRIILAGDFNGTLKPPRKYNKHDRLLQAFVLEMSLKQSYTDKSTFFHHSGLSCSQIDYILDNTTSSIISSYKTHDRCPSNSSSHVPVSAKIDVKAKVKQSPVKPNSARQFKFQWKDIDSESFNSFINEELSQYNIEKHSLEENIQFLCNCLKKAAAVAVPSKIIKLKGPKFKASPTTLSLLQICKEKYQLWKSNGKHDDHFKSDKILAQRNLRKQMRREQFRASILQRSNGQSKQRNVP